MKTRELLDNLKQKYIFGTYKGSVYTIEYQKQGLPHMYLLLFLLLEEQFRNAEQVDEIISAKFPTATDDSDGILMDMVASVMVHGPCGELNPKVKCMTLDLVTNCKKCCKSFPKLFQPETIIHDDGYSLYCCQNNGMGYDISHLLYNRQSYQVTNKWVIFYNTYLLCKYHVHINVESCRSVKAIKYIQKYIYKGSDRATAEVAGVDEIIQHLNGCYIGPAEGAWNLMEFPVHEEYSLVQKLTIHLPNQQVVYFKPSMTEEEIQNKIDRSYSMLMAQDSCPHYYAMQWKRLHNGNGGGEI